MKIINYNNNTYKYKDKLFQLCKSYLIPRNTYNSLCDSNFDLLAELLDFSKL